MSWSKELYHEYIMDNQNQIYMFSGPTWNKFHLMNCRIINDALKKRNRNENVRNTAVDQKEDAKLLKYVGQSLPFKNKSKFSIKQAYTKHNNNTQAEIIDTRLHVEARERAKLGTAVITICTSDAGTIEAIKD
eukprot:462455_1